MEEKTLEDAEGPCWTGDSAAAGAVGDEEGAVAKVEGRRLIPSGGGDLARSGAGCEGGLGRCTIMDSKGCCISSGSSRETTLFSWLSRPARLVRAEVIDTGEPLLRASLKSTSSSRPVIELLHSAHTVAVVRFW